MKKLFIRGQVEKIAENEYRVLASTSAIDRQGDSIDQSGWQIANYLKNPVMLWAHIYDELPIAKATKIEVTSRGLEMTFEFVPPEGNPKASQVKYCYDNGFLNAVSVGFICQERQGNIITRAELLEVSFVPVPANQEALRLAMSKGLDVSEIKEQLEKGEVADELEAEEKIEAKYQKWNEVCEILSALWTVYFDETTPVESFSTLLTEAVSLLQALSANGGEDDDTQTAAFKEKLSKAINKDTVSKFLEAMFVKEGRTLSSKTLEKINTAIESMKTASGHLTTLVEESSKDKGAKGEEGDKPNEPAPVPAPAESKEDTLKGLAVSTLTAAQGLLRANAKSNETTLKFVNDSLDAFQKSKGK